MGNYADDLGARLRAIRLQKGLSLHAVEQASGGRWKAVVVGSYERGDRAVSVSRLADLADFYEIPVAELLPVDGAPPPIVPASGRLVLDLGALQHVTAAQAAPLLRYAQSIQSQRGDYNGRVLSIRADDLRALAIMCESTPADLADQLIGWGVLRSDQPTAAATV